VLIEFNSYCVQQSICCRYIFTAIFDSSDVIFPVGLCFILPGNLKALHARSRLKDSFRNAQVVVLKSRKRDSFGHSSRWRLLLSLIKAILLFREVTTIRGRSGFTSISPVFLLFRSDKTRDQPPFRALACLTAKRDKSNGRLNPTIRSPCRTAAKILDL